MKRDRFLAALDPKFSDFLAAAEISNDAACIKYAAFPERDPETEVLTTTRGKVIDWKYFTFRTWPELITVLKKFRQVKNYIGWFFTDIDGPYYRLSLNAFLSNIGSIEKYGVAQEQYDFGWVGADDDVGIIMTYSRVSSSANKFEVCVWGI